MYHERQPGLGRRYIFDRDDQKFKLRATSPKRGVRRKTHFVRGVLDQGSTPQCVAYSGVKLLEAHPVKNKWPAPIHELYRECQRNDEWPGTGYDGTSVRACMKVFKEHGFISEYRWAWDTDTMINHILSTGPMQIGVDWFRSMFTPTGETELFDADFIILDGENDGGHALLVIGYDMDMKVKHHGGEKGAFRLLNSWGSRWADDGRVWMARRDMQTLLDMNGEAAVATEIQKAV